MTRPTADQVKELREHSMFYSNHMEGGYLALCDDWLAQEAVVEAAIEYDRDGSRQAYRVLRQALARLDAAGATPTPQEGEVTT